MKKKLVYLSHPSGGLEDNTKDIEKCIRLLYKNKEFASRFTIVSPVHCYGFMYNDDWLTYEEGLDMCLELLEHCDFMLCIGDYSNSKGCKKEISVCKHKGVPVAFIENSEYLESNIQDACIDIIKKFIF